MNIKIFFINLLIYLKLKMSQEYKSSRKCNTEGYKFLYDSIKNSIKDSIKDSITDSNTETNTNTDTNIHRN